jgi:hypothetical protein
VVGYRRYKIVLSSKDEKLAYFQKEDMSGEEGVEIRLGQKYIVGRHQQVGDFANAEMKPSHLSIQIDESFIDNNTLWLNIHDLSGLQTDFIYYPVPGKLSYEVAPNFWWGRLFGALHRSVPSFVWFTLTPSGRTGMNALKTEYPEVYRVASQLTALGILRHPFSVRRNRDVLHYLLRTHVAPEKETEHFFRRPIREALSVSGGGENPQVTFHNLVENGIGAMQNAHRTFFFPAHRRVTTSVAHPERHATLLSKIRQQAFALTAGPLQSIQWNPQHPLFERLLEEALRGMSLQHAITNMPGRSFLEVSS